MNQCFPSLTEKACTLSGGGFVGLFIGFFCPLCVPASAAVLSAIGLTFLPQAQFIFPLIAIFSVVLLGGLITGLKRHGDISPLLFGSVGIFMVPVGRYILGSAMLTYVGAFCIIGATVWNVFLQVNASKHHYIDEEDFQKMVNNASA